MTYMKELLAWYNCAVKRYLAQKRATGRLRVPSVELEKDYQRYFTPRPDTLQHPSVYFRQPTIYVDVPTVVTYGGYEEPI